MQNTQTQTLTKIDWKSISWFIGLMGIAIILPRLIHNQFVTGPIVNATLFLGAYYLGNGSGALIGLVPSVTALSAGLLPIVLAPIVPFIMISNVLLVVVFNKLKDWNFGGAVIASSLVKYVFLSLSAMFVINTFMPQNLVAKAAGIMMTWPQLVTALAGAIIAFGIIKLTKKEEISE
ncbi:MAG: ECF transporter S component [Candidatus Berkelbacteria bacterium]